MLKGKTIGIGLFSFLILVSFTPNSEAELWELVVDLNLQKVAINPGENVVVSGKVVDHAYKPIRGIEVITRIGTDTIKTFTNPAGEFKAEFKDFQKMPGTYNVNVVATWYEMKGLASTQVQVTRTLEKSECYSIRTRKHKLATLHKSDTFISKLRLPLLLSPMRIFL